MRRAMSALLLLLFCALACSSAAAADDDATNATAPAACGTVVGGPCCPGKPAWTCAADLVCLDHSDAGKTTCNPMPGSPAAPCGGPGQPCCPDAYHRHTDKVLPPACADGFCNRSAGVSCGSLSWDGLAPCGLCMPNPAGCGGSVGAPCCRFSKGGPSDWFTCGAPPVEGGAPPPGSLACDIVVGAEPKCVAAT